MKRLLAVLVLLALAVPASAGGVQTIYGADATVRSVFALGPMIYVFLDGDSYPALVPGEEGTTAHSFDQSLLVREDGWSEIAAVFAGEGGAHAFVYDYEMDGEEHILMGARLCEVIFAEDGAAALGDGIQLDWDETGSDGYGVPIWCPVVSGDSLAFLYGTKRSRMLALADLRTGDCHAPGPAVNAQGLYTYRDGKLLLTRRDGRGRTDLFALDSATGETESLCAISGANMMEIANLAYDLERDLLYYTLSGTLYKMDGMNPETAKKIGVIPVDGWDDGFAAVASGTYAVCADDMTVFARSTEPDADVAARLTVADPWGNVAIADAVLRFSGAHPDVEVTFDTSFSDVLTAMLTKSSAVDIYVLPAEQLDYVALRQRGYLAELSGSVILTELMEGMYPCIRDMVSKDGALVAMPVSFSALTQGVNLEALSQIGLTEADVPETWPEFLALLERLPDLIADTEITAFWPDMAAEEWRFQVFSALFLDYLAAANGMPDESELVALLTAFEKIDFDALGLPRNEAAVMYEYSEDIWRSALFDLFKQVSLEFYAYDDESWKLMPLAIRAGGTQMVSGRLSVAVVNPYSQNRALAVAFLEEATAQLPAVFLAETCPARNESVRVADYGEMIARLEENMEETRAALETAADEEKEMWEDILAETEQYYESYMGKGSWLVSPEAITWYRPYAELIGFEQNLGIERDNYFAFASEMERYLDGQMSAEEFARAVADKIAMAEMEGM